MQTLPGKNKPLVGLRGTEQRKLQLCRHGSLNLTEDQKTRGGLVPKCDCRSHLLIYISH